MRNEFIILALVIGMLAGYCICYSGVDVPLVGHASLSYWIGPDAYYIVSFGERSIPFDNRTSCLRALAQLSNAIANVTKWTDGLE
jgi:hypothetical protein